MVDGSLELEFCAAPARGSIRFLSEYEVELEPNPVYGDDLKLKFKSSGDIESNNIVVDIEILDISGNRVLKDRFTLNKPEQDVIINLSDISSSGMYYILIGSPYSTPIAMSFVLVR